MVETARVTTTASLRRDAILEAVAFAAEQLLLAADWRDAADPVLKRLGGAADVSRAYVIRTVLDGVGRQRCRQLAEWCADGVASQAGNPVLQDAVWADFGFGRWVEEMSAGRSIAGPVEELPASERPALAGQDIVSLASFPIFVAGTWWGLIGFDDCRTARDWSRAELDALRASASVLGAAIQRQLADERVRRTEERYRRVVERIPAVTYTDIPGEHGVRMGFVSPQVTTILGFSPDRFVDDPSLWFGLIHPDDRERLVHAGVFDPSDVSPFDEEYRMQAADGRWVWIHDTSTPVLAPDGRVEYFLGFATDVTTRREAEERLRSAEEQFRTIVEQTPAITYQELLPDGVYDPATVVSYVSPQMHRLLGYAPEEWASPGFWRRVIHPEDEQRVLEESDRIQAAGETSYRQDYRMRARDGRLVWFHDESTLISDGTGRPLLWQGVMVDITERKVAEEQLRRAQERLEALIAHIPAVVYIESPDADPAKFYISPQVETIFGYTAAEWTWTRDFWLDRVHPLDREGVGRTDHQSSASHTPMSMDYRFRRADDRYVWVHDEAVFLPGADGGFWQGLLFDITSRKEAEHLLLEAELKFRTLVEQNPAIFYTQDIDPDDPSVSKTTYIAPGNADLIGYSLEDVERDPTLWRKIIHPADRDRVLRADAESNTSGEDTFSMEYRVLGKDGRIVWVQDEARLVRLPDKPPYWQGFLLDISERKEAEAQLERALVVEREASQRLRMLDEMKNTFLQAVSHDLRTPLAAILGLAITLERGDVHLEEVDARDLAHRIADNARRLDRLVTNLLDLDRLARGIVAPKLEPTDVGALVRRIVAESDLVTESRIHTDIGSVVIRADPAKVERIVEKLLANAARHTPPDASVWVSVHPAAGGVTIAVEDDGAGVPADLREALFEPFRQGPDAPQHSPGVGVGLTLVQRFAELHGGRAWVQDREGGGASFLVFLPHDPPPGPEAGAR